jgi:hypothetical protein
MSDEVREMVERLRTARANGDPKKYMAFVTVEEAHAIADLLARVAQERAEARVLIERWCWAYDARSDHGNIFADLEALHRGWDGEGAEPISPDTLSCARRLSALLPRSFPPPHVAPAADGTIGFEWVLEDAIVRKVFIDVGPGTRLSAYVRTQAGRTRSWPPRPFNIGAYLIVDELSSLIRGS